MPSCSSFSSRAIDGRRGLVQNQDGRIAQQRAGEGHQLLLTLREVAAALLDGRVVAVLQVADEVVRAHAPGGLDDLLVGGVQPAVADVLLERAGGSTRTNAA